MKILLNKKTKIIFILVFLIFTLTTTVFADTTKGTVKDVFTDADKFVSDDIEKDVPGLPDESDIQDLSKIVSGVLIAVGIIVAFTMVAILGINFMIQSTEEKAKIKEAMVPFIIGLIVTF